MSRSLAAGERTMPLLEGRNLRKTYRLGKRNIVAALRGVDISIEQGEMVAIMGPSGSGKSTLMHILAALDKPTSGSVTIAGEDVGSMSDTDVSWRRASRAEAGVAVRPGGLSQGSPTRGAGDPGTWPSGTQAVNVSRS